MAAREITLTILPDDESVIFDRFVGGGEFPRSKPHQAESTRSQSGNLVLTGASFVAPLVWNISCFLTPEAADTLSHIYDLWDYYKATDKSQIPNLRISNDTTPPGDVSDNVFKVFFTTNPTFAPVGRWVRVGVILQLDSIVS